jgi:hypothetical protein
MIERLPSEVDRAVSVLSPIFSNTRNGAAGDWQNNLPIIQRVPMTSPAGPSYRVELTGNASAGGATPGGPLPAPGNSHKEHFQQGYGYYTGSIRMTDKDMRQIASGQLKIAGFLESEKQSLVDGLVNSVASDAFLGNAANRIDGLHSIAVSDTAAYGGIARIGNTNFQSQVHAGGGARDLTSLILEQAWDLSFVTAEMLPGTWFAITDGFQFGRCRNLTTNVSTRTTQTNLQLIGASGVMIMDAPLFRVPNAVAGEIMFLRAESLEWSFLNDVPFNVLEPQYSGDTVEFIVNTYCQLTLRNPRKSSFIITNLNN